MSTTDSFIDEVTEEVRRDRLFALFRRWGWAGAVAVVLIVGGAAWVEWQKMRSAQAAQAAGDALLAALELPEAADRAAALAGSGVGGPLTALLIAGQALEAGDLTAALGALDALAADQGQPQLYRDLASLRALILRAGTMAPADRIAALQPLAIPGAVFAQLAQEQIALARIEAGDPAGARATLEAIVADAATPQGLRSRAGALLAALGEAPDAAPDAAPDTGAGAGAEADVAGGGGGQ